MSIEKTLKKEIAEADKFLSSLGPEGKSFRDRLADIRMDIAPIPDHSLHQAAYDLADNVFYCPPGAPLTLRFNYRVHEGAHAVQAQEAPALMKRLTAPVQLTPESVVKFRRAVEQDAHAVQGYFDALAVRKTGNAAFVDDLNVDAVLEPYVNLLKGLISDGRRPLAVGQAIARTFLNHMIRLTVPGERADQTLNIKQGALLDMMSLVQYDALVDMGKVAPARADITRAEFKGLLNGVIIIDPRETILNSLEAPLKLSAPNRKLYKDLQTKMASLKLS